MAKFILADNQDLTRIGVESIITKDKTHSWQSVSDKATLIEQLKKDEERIIILDYTLFDFSDVDSLIIASERFPFSQWILLCNDLTDSFIRKIIYSTHNISIAFKDSSVKVIIEAIDSVLHGKRFIRQRALEILLEKEQKINDAPSRLTYTEKEILKVIAQGKTTKEIAAERFCSIHTVNTHRKNIFSKLGVNTAHEAIKYALRAGIVDTEDFYI